jgi:hypothetical protein
MVKRMIRRQQMSTVGQLVERLEERCLLSAAHGVVHAIAFSDAPAAVQAGLDDLATHAGLDSPAGTQTVYLGNVKGKETYTVDLSSTGTSSVLTVDQNGKAVTAPVKTTVTVADVANSAVTDEFNAIATALGLTAPTPTGSVKVLTADDGSAVYTISLSTGTGRHARSKSFSVDSAGNPTGNEQVPLSVLSAAIQDGLTSNAPAGATALTDASPIAVQTKNGVTTYSATYRSPGIKTVVTVDNTGALTNLPSTSTVKFADIPPAAQTALQTLATNNGFTGTIADDASVKAYDEANGTVIYAVRLPVTGTGNSGSTYTYMIVVAADQSGNPTVPPGDDHGPGGCDDQGGRGGRGGRDDRGGRGETESGDDSPGTLTTPANFSGFSRFAREHGFRF